jgi:hypothetical protein
VLPRKTSGGQETEAPVQVSAWSQMPFAERQTWLGGCTAFGGHALFTPSQVSATSQTSEAERQVTLVEATASAGQFTFEPSQTSCTSQIPEAVRQTKPDGRFVSEGQLAVPPGHVSATSHAPAEERQTVPNWKPSPGQAAAEPVQLSALSHTPAELRHTVVAGLNASAGQAPADPLHVSALSQTPADDRQTAPEVRNVQFALQHDAVVPFPEPSSHCSPNDESTVPLPQRLSSWTETQWPSGACGRLFGLPAPYVPAVWLPNVAGNPMRSAASSPPLKKLHPLVADALQVKRRVCDFATPLLVPVMTAFADRSKFESVLPVEFTLPGSVRLSVPDASVPPVWVPVTGLMSTWAESPSSTVVKAPLTLVEMFRR